MINKISNISFKGTLTKASYMKQPASYQEQEEMADMKKFAKQSGCDVFVYNRDYYANGEGAYDAIIVKETAKTAKKVSFNYGTNPTRKVEENTIKRVI